MDYSPADLMAIRVRKRLGLLDDGLPERQAAEAGARADGPNGLLDMRHAWDAPMQEMSASKPTYRDKLATWVADKMGVDPTSVAGGRLTKGLVGSTGTEGEGTGLLDIVPGFSGISAAQKIKEAGEDPNLANLTGAGVRTGAAIASAAPIYGPAMKAGMGLASGIGGLGFAEALRRDMGGVSSAKAAGETEDPQIAAIKAEIMRLEGEGKTDIPGRSKVESMAIRAQAREQAATMRGRLADMMAEKARAAGNKEKATFDEATARANKLYDAEMARANDRFSNTEVSKVYKATGGYAPFVAGTAAGALSRAAPKGNFLNSPMTGGALLGVTANNAPLAYDAYMTPVENPEKRAYEVLGRELPDGHPGKQKAIDTAFGMPKDNPVRSGAQAEFYDPQKLTERMGLGLLEGVGGGIVGSHLVDVPGAMAKKAAAMSGRMSEVSAAANNKAATQRAIGELAATKKEGLISAAKGDAAGAAQTAAEARRLAEEAQRLSAGGSRTVGASSGLMEDPPVQTGLVPVQPPPPPPPVSTGNRALPAPEKQPRGWVHNWSDPARQAVLEFKTNSPDAKLTSLSGVQLRKMIIEKLPPGVKEPSQQTVNGYFKALKEDVGADASLAKLKKTLKGNYNFTVPAIAAGGLGLMSGDAHSEPTVVSKADDLGAYGPPRLLDPYPMGDARPPNRAMHPFDALALGAAGGAGLGGLVGGPLGAGIGATLGGAVGGMSTLENHRAQSTADNAFKKYLEAHGMSDHFQEWMDSQQKR